MRGAKAQVVNLSDAEKRGLEKLIKRHQVGQQIAKRARIVLAAAEWTKEQRDCTSLPSNSGYSQLVEEIVG